MKNLLCGLAATLLGSALGAAAQAQPTAGALQPVQTIALGTHYALGGTVQLPNHHTLLLLTDTESANVHLQCLGPDGQTVWENNVERYQQASDDVYYQAPYVGAGPVPASRESREQLAQVLPALLLPVEVFTDGSTVYLVERIGQHAARKQPKGGPLREGQVYVHRLDEQGQLTRATFEARAQPAVRNTEVEVLGRYADAQGYAEVVREYNKRQESLLFFVDHYDPATQAIRRAPLNLPATPKLIISSFTSFRYWYQEWVFLGHRPNQTYFCRRILSTGPNSKPSELPPTAQVYVVDDHQAEVGGFSTLLSLQPGTMPNYSGTMAHTGELNHLPFLFSVSYGGNYTRPFDAWTTSSGGLGSFHLDHASGDVLIFGEYAKGEKFEGTQLSILAGYFQRRYTLGGTLVNQVQTVYTDDLLYPQDKPDDKLRKPFYLPRFCRFHLDPFTGQSKYSFASGQAVAATECITLSFDQGLHFQGYDYVASQPQEQRLFTAVLFAEPYWLYKPHTTRDYRVYQHVAPADAPVFAALEKQRRSAGPQLPYHEFHLSATGPGTGVVVERPQLVGGILQVYKF